MKTCENCKMNRLCKELDALGYTRECNTLHPIHKTNADKFRQLSNEELAEVCFGGACPYSPCPHLDDEIKCKECFLDWLGQEANDADWLKQEVESDG